LYWRFRGPDLRHNLRIGARTQHLYGSAGQRHDFLRQAGAQAIRCQDNPEFQGLHDLRCAQRAQTFPAPRRPPNHDLRVLLGAGHSHAGDTCHITPKLTPIKSPVHRE
jgi:hypothetical protein